MLSINQEETALYFEVNVFPREDWTRFAITRSLVDSARGSINVEDLYAHASQVVAEVTGTAIDILYDVNVLYATAEVVIGEEVLEIRKLADASMKEYPSFLDIDLSKELAAHINSGSVDGRELPHKVWIREVVSDKIDRKSFVGARVILFPALRDVARLLYKRPLREPLFGYEITVYDGSEKVLGELAKYIAMVEKANNALPLLLPLPLPLGTEEFPFLSRIIFIARRGEKIIGYCGCALLPYRIEVERQFSEAMGDMMKKFSPSKPPEARIIERIFMGVQPHNIFEIEGLSASPYETGKNIGIALVYEALRFIRDPLMSRLYPVSHIASQAASYITKRLLVTNFHFRYHGSNHFQNEGFVEIISAETKAKLVTTLTELVSYYLVFMRSKSMVEKFHQKREGEQEASIQLMLINVVKLYQLYYLMLKWDRPSANFAVKNDATLTALLDLFRLLIKVLASTSKIGKYFRVAIQSLEAYVAKSDASTLERIDATIVWDDGTPQLYDEETEKPLPPKYGFMIKPEYARDSRGRATKRKIKYPYVEGYDVIYAVLPNIIEISDVLLIGQATKARIAKIVLEPVNQLVLKDVVEPYDYELPTDQLVGIRDALKHIIRDKSMPTQEKTLGETRRQLKTHLALMDKNADFTSKFNSLFDLVGSLDCFISLDLLKSEWLDTERNVLAKFVGQPVPKQQPLPLLYDQVPLVLPTTRERLFEQINALYKIIWPNVDRAALVVSFNGSAYTIATLITHFNTLMSMENTIGIVIEILDSDEQSFGEMEVEGAHVGYRLEDFIDDDDEEEDVTENVLNKALI